MRNTFTLLFFSLCCSLFSLARDTQDPSRGFRFRLEGKLSNASSVKVYLKEVAFWKQQWLMDTVTTDNEGRFVFTAAITEASQFELTAEGSQESVVFVIADKLIRLSADLNDLRYSFLVEGSHETEVQEAFNTLKDREAVIYGVMEEWRSKMAIAVQKGDSSEIDHLQQSGFKIETDLINMRKAVILQYPDALTSLLRLPTIQSPSRDLGLQDSILTIFEKASLGEHSLVKYFREQLSVRQRLLSGNVAPDFSLPDLTGKDIRLSSLRGSYVLIDFWASWCEPCREENSKLVDTYKRFGGKQFTILSVSFDKDVNKWKNAVAADKLTWFNVSAVEAFLSDVAQRYVITGLPTSILIDPEGKIIGRDLRGAQLDIILSALVPSGSINNSKR